MNRKISLELNPWGPHPSLNWDEKNHHRVFILTSSKQRPVKKFHVVVVHGKEIYQAACYTRKICCLTFKTFCFLTQLFWLLSPSSLLNPLSFIDVCSKLL